MPRHRSSEEQGAPSHGNAAKFHYTAAALILAVPPVRASTCAERIAVFMDEYRLTGGLRVDPPIAITRPSPMIEPRESPAGDLDRSASMPTGTTELPPPRAELGPVERTTLETLLEQARAADARGDEAECFEQLGEAIGVANRAGLGRPP